jgi:hypothetical protein
MNERESGKEFMEERYCQSEWREYVDNYKYLGVWIDCKLSFQTHIKHLQSKIKSRIQNLFFKSRTYFAEKHPSLMLPNIPSKN